MNPSDVKDFIRFLAVQCRVSASSKNQAFNALLFLYEEGVVPHLSAQFRNPSVASQLRYPHHSGDAGTQ
ncbi:MAG: hypothetical protein E3K36_15445 [Candidatus Brocadia sp.]|nr:hypothetical protein [Candidatus Brocadia sp.]